MTTHRHSCGSQAGMRAHDLHHEPLCGTCQLEDAWRVLAVELIPHPPTEHTNVGYAPVTRAQAAANAHALFVATRPRRTT